jgi:cytochrome c oxidase cbb3-type subunit 3
MFIGSKRIEVKVCTMRIWRHHKSGNGKAAWLQGESRRFDLWAWRRRGYFDVPEMRMLRFFLVLGMLTLVGRAGALAQEADDAKEGQRIFEQKCGTCHGPHGEGGRGPTLAQPKLPRAPDDNALMNILRDGIRGTEMAPQLLTEHDMNRVARYVRSLGTKPPEPLPGDPKRGEGLYAAKGCAQCHMLHGRGGAFGPDLDDIGLRRSVAYLRRALVDPGAEVPKSYSQFAEESSLPLNFLYVRCVPKSGEEVDGVRVNEDTFSIQIRDAQGRLHSFYKDELAELHKEFGKSPMPSFATTMSTNEVNDLTAFLATLRR